MVLSPLARLPPPGELVSFPGFPLGGGSQPGKDMEQ